MAAHNPSDIVARAPMSALQITAVTMCVLLTALDGFDVLSISFAAPGIAEEWGIDRGALGLVLSMELLGMAVGSILLGGLADRVGRRPTILVCLVIMSAGMLAVPYAPGITELSAFRFGTGLGIGGMLAATNAMTAEYANDKYKSLAVMFMAAGYPMGVIAAGSVASQLLTHFDWRSVFFLGAGITATFIPLVLLLLPESIGYLNQRRPPNALQRINKTLARMKHGVIEALAEPAVGGPRTGFAALFGPNLALTTIVLTLAYFAHIMTFYFTLKWIPKIVVDMGYEPSQAGGVLVWANVGGALGAVLLGLLSQRFNVRALVIMALVGGFGTVALFGQGQADLSELALVAGAAGFFTNAAIVGLYALFALAYPTAVRATGTGFVIGVGRGGAALGPIIGGYLFQFGFGLPIVALGMAAGSLFALVVLLFLPSQRTAPAYGSAA